MYEAVTRCYATAWSKNATCTRCFKISLVNCNAADTETGGTYLQWGREVTGTHTVKRTKHLRKSKWMRKRSRTGRCNISCHLGGDRGERKEVWTQGDSARRKVNRRSNRAGRGRHVTYTSHWVTWLMASEHWQTEGTRWQGTVCQWDAINLVQRRSKVCDIVLNLIFTGQHIVVVV